MKQKPFLEEVRAGTPGQAAGGRSARRQRREGGTGEALGEGLSSPARGTFYIHFRSVPGHSGVAISPPTKMQGTGHRPSSHRKSRPWPLEHSFHPERLTTNRSMSEENEAGRWGGYCSVGKDQKEPPPPQMTSGQRYAEVKGETGRRVGKSIPVQEEPVQRP